MAALQDLLKLHDDSLEEAYAKKPHDPTKARKSILAGVERTKNQFASATPVKGRKWFKVQNGIVETNLPFAVEGKSRFLTPSERYPDFLATLHKLVEGGSLDDAIASMSEDKAQGDEVRAATNPRGPKKGAGWSDARRAAHEARMAAKKA